MSSPQPSIVRDCHLILENEEIHSLKEQLFSRGNQRLREISRLRRAKEKEGGKTTEQGVTELATHWCTELDGAGVAEAVFLCEAPTTRDHVFSLIEKGQGRVKAFTNLDPLQTWSAEDLKRDVARGFSGLNLLPALQHFHVYDRRGYGLYETCERLSVPVTVHFGVTSCIYADLRFANPLDLQPVARDFPDVNFIIPSFGAGFLREVLLLMSHCHNVFTDTSGPHLWLRFQPERLNLDDVFRRVLDVAGPHRVLFGTGSGEVSVGYRNELLHVQRSVLESLDLPEVEKRLILGDNLQTLLEAVDRDAATEQRQPRLRLGASASWRMNKKSS